ncbi:tRNA (5-methylaminomethyl-2-thiouridine)(34)-methyltransferase MnmD [Sediminibacterium ginsengisoli]|uniref:tRNA U34 5-methylaminomethyl-2-thiouridine-forming methyltransferase MnmC n=1 Tax=Sediminibacterium ginsengisoli TaxID=413434 RepID=A0A1T4NN80_9BACT|nr:tRNA (5-methylaminomethyl-2-thiouridine)(34)-methyltransferase MnmD [Sediminibacterium ginsengisoli]SJZ80741.1 tRNA U34 5-methylaminomethyl-2-thiouridine-forming methyltransferase MnmC [Sediminibacterium ginsengisoli]
MQRELLITADGSHTIAVPELQATYHSRHGAIAESMHVFIGAGLYQLPSVQPLRILEIGFGTGLNALLTLRHAQDRQQEISYHSLEPFPLTDAEVQQLNHGESTAMQQEYEAIHRAAFDQPVIIHPFFTLHKHKISLETFDTTAQFHCIYFDAFAPETQPELWTKAIFEKLHRMMFPGGLLLTYCSKSIVRKAMQEAGWLVKKIPGPHGKREMVRAYAS